jgi:uncharacterized OB-fold protein
MTFYEKQTDPSTPMHWPGNMQADYFYPNGVAGNKFFKHIKEKDTFIAAKCKKCNKTYFPPRIFCEDCFCEITNNDWFEVPATGTIKLSTLVTIDTNGNTLYKPIIIALINIDKTDGNLLGIIKTNEYNKDLVGKKVEAVFKPKNRREGTLKDIKYFKEK